MYNFLWKGKDKIKRLALISDYKDGGLRMPHIQSAIMAQRIMRLTKYPEEYFSPWKFILSTLFKDFGSKFILHCNFKTGNYLPDCIPKFYRDCFTTWSNINQDTEQISSGTDVLKEVLWNNQYLRIDGKPVFYKKIV